MGSSPLELPPPAEAALLLDLDGTLLDLAPTPDSVVVPPDLPDTLRRLRAHLGDALAIVTGRPIDQIDALLADAPYAVAGEHGGAIRHQPGRPGGAPRPCRTRRWNGCWRRPRSSTVTPAPCSSRNSAASCCITAWRRSAARRCARPRTPWWRRRPQRFQVLEAAMAWEMRPRGVDKGVAVAALAAEAPFAGRRPIFIGDDVTDEDGMRAARELAGAGLRVDTAFGSPEAVRAWLRRSAELLDSGAGRWAGPRATQPLERRSCRFGAAPGHPDA